MKAAFYQVQGSTRDVLEVGEVAEPVPGRGGVRRRVVVLGLNPSDIKAAAYVPEVGTRVRLDQIVDAQKAMESAAVIGKILVEVTSDAR
ncbi:hypothetical protein N5J43_27105 [Pseudomonas nicosulfuronedens]|uniref:Uncharacterized protein n=1 Tax=Pseudomonas nicosulfuronedens TaxID=2571105 RepID=A0A5R9QTB3_9PSED|nr:hypothetical protein [Pseudomonas nicosulfuronedens]MDH1010648.1 hypothetical protein [Pseudomonas nicosulfuronedens]MDH1982639.1 hypothetical protein [Pseudomonas nicosulfuronedens]MDH2025847.1 hypothetical protein [Pseudomonas nicosulfuronedens]TLX72477.1 hypothetical protein FAS41_22635 [Pseudomonas nicosulfuronedens]